MNATKPQAISSVVSDPVSPATAQRYELSPDLVTLSEARASEAEAVRTIRTHVIARHIKAGRRGVSVCGPSAGIGCTFTAVNLAVSLAQVGVATLLIDGDMRSPAVDRLIRPQSPSPGLHEYISSEDLLAGECIHSEVLPSLSVLYAGSRSESAQELLAGERFRRLIERCLRDYEFTVIDTPPANLCADARRIGSVVGYTLIVARTHTTLMGDVTNLAQRLQEDGTRVVGTILNEV